LVDIDFHQDLPAHGIEASTSECSGVEALDMDPLAIQDTPDAVDFAC
jgi:hypothetical protein